MRTLETQRSELIDIRRHLSALAFHTFKELVNDTAGYEVETLTRSRFDPSAGPSAT